MIVILEIGTCTPKQVPPSEQGTSLLLVFALQSRLCPARAVDRTCQPALVCHKEDLGLSETRTSQTELLPSRETSGVTFEGSLPEFLSTMAGGLLVIAF